MIGTIGMGKCQVGAPEVEAAPDQAVGLAVDVSLVGEAAEVVAVGAVFEGAVGELVVGAVFAAVRGVAVCQRQTCLALAPSVELERGEVLEAYSEVRVGQLRLATRPIR